MREKVYRKSRAFHKHGKHGGMRGITAEINRQQEQRKAPTMEPLNLSKDDWSRK